MKTAYSYVRFSTPDQEMGDSERRQLASAQLYCERHGLRLAERVTKCGVSGYHGKNHTSGALGRLLKIMKPGDQCLADEPV